MKVWIIIKNEGMPYEPYPQVKKVYTDEENANAYVEKNDKFNNYDVEEWDVE